MHSISNQNFGDFLTFVMHHLQNCEDKISNALVSNVEFNFKERPVTSLKMI